MGQMKMMKVFQQLSQAHQSNNQAQAQPIQLVLGQTQQQPQDNMFKKMMMKMMMKKMFGEQEQESQTNNYLKSSPFGNMESRMNTNNKYEMMEQMMKTFMHQKHERAADDVFELGDRLTEKLKAETATMQAKLGSLPAFSKNLESSTKTKILMSTKWSNLLKMENGDNTQTNGSESTISKTAKLVQHMPILSQNPFLTNVHMARNGDESFFSSNVKRKPSTSSA